MSKRLVFRLSDLENDDLPGFRLEETRPDDPTELRLVLTLPASATPYDVPLGQLVTINLLAIRTDEAVTLALDGQAGFAGTLFLVADTDLASVSITALAGAVVNLYASGELT